MSIGFVSLKQHRRQRQTPYLTKMPGDRTAVTCVWSVHACGETPNAACQGLETSNTLPALSRSTDRARKAGPDDVVFDAGRKAPALQISSTFEGSVMPIEVLTAGLGGRTEVRWSYLCSCTCATSCPRRSWKASHRQPRERVCREAVACPGCPPTAPCLGALEPRARRQPSRPGYPATLRAIVRAMSGHPAASGRTESTRVTLQPREAAPKPLTRLNAAVVLVTPLQTTTP